MTPLWPLQERGINGVFDAIDAGIVRILLTSPTGTGKSRMVCEIIDRLAGEHGWDVILYTNRRPLIEQLSDVLTKHGIDFGVRAAGYDDEAPFPVQISSIPTEISRVVKRQRWTLHGKGKRCLVVVDEAHLNDGEEARKLYALHREEGHVLLGVTATPLDLGASYDHLVIAGRVSDGRNCGALVWAHHYGPDEPDWKSLKKKPADGDELSENQAKSLMGKVTNGGPDKRLRVLYGRVWDNFERLNPERRPTVLFAPGVDESIWFAQKFTENGCRFAHIDGDDIWIDGELHRASPELRKEVFGELRTGKLIGICNRFVMREGIDVREIGHIILATVMGGLKTYLQSVGRGLRACEGKTHLVVQDHGANWLRHGSANEDRDWDLDLTASAAYGIRADRMRRKKLTEPFLCPQCGRVWAVKGQKCSCGYVLTKDKYPRAVVTAEGTLKPITSDFFRPHRVTKDTRGPSDWERMYWRSRTEKGRRTFAAAFALFAQEHNWGWPDRSWPLMPVNDRDVYLLVEEVPFDRLTSVPPKKESA